MTQTQWTPWGQQDLPEDAIHRSIMSYLEAVLPESAMAFHPMQNPRSAKAGANFKRMGMKAGIPDIGIIRATGRIYWIEVKARKGRLSLSQKAFQMWCVQWGVPWCLARSIDDVRDFLQQHDFEIREAA